MNDFQYRYLESLVSEDLDRKMVFIGGPRQVGKTTLARRLGRRLGAPTYLNRDNRGHRQAILGEQPHTLR